MKERELIINNKLKSSTEKHPDENIKDKNWIAELFVRDFKNAHIVNNDCSGKCIHKISINNEIFNFSFDTTDAGGAFNRRKVGIPFASKKFRELLENNEMVYVVNIYRPLNSDLTVDEETRVWLFPDPLEVYNSKAYIKSTWNDSSRWISNLKIMENIKSDGITLNDRKNVFAATNSNVEELFNDYSFKSRYYLMNKFEGYVKSYLSLEDDDNEEMNKKMFSSVRRTFRLLLLQQECINNQINSKVRNQSLMIASHIHSVEEIKSDKSLDINDKLERIKDEKNGLLIPVGLDKLFDKYYVTFNDDWTIKLSNEVTEVEVQEMCGREIEGVWIQGKDKGSLEYLRKHREKAFRKRDYS